MGKIKTEDMDDEKIFLGDFTQKGFYDALHFYVLMEGTNKMNCEYCGIKIMVSVARQQEGDETFCRECYTWKLAREQR